MKTVDKYRFSLQWAADTSEKIQAGEFLEKLGNKKSEFVVLAITEYLKAHPDILSKSHKINIIVKPSFTSEQIDAMVVAAIRKHMDGIESVSIKTVTPNREVLPDETNIDIMIKNLDMFST